MLKTRPQVMLMAIGLSCFILWVGQAHNAKSHPNYEEASYYSSYGGARTSDAIVGQAKSYLGTAYGSGAGAMTCTEFSRATFGPTTGVWLPTVPAAQMNYGWQPRHPHRGDLLFYDEGGYGISHVAIKLGGGRIIHASNYFG